MRPTVLDNTQNTVNKRSGYLGPHFFGCIAGLQDPARARRFVVEVQTGMIVWELLVPPTVLQRYVYRYSNSDQFV